MSSVPVMTWNPASRLDPLYDAEDATQLPVNLQGAGASAPTVSYPKGQVLGEVAATPGLFAPYKPGATDGTQNAKMILRYACQVVGAAGAVGAITAWGEWPGVTRSAVPAFKSGDFDLAQIAGLDATALAAMAGSIKAGVLGTAESDSIVINATGGTWGVTIPTVTVNGVVYPAVVLANTAIAWNVSAANLATAINNALAAAGIPASVTVTGGPGATNPLVVVWHGAYAAVPLIAVTDATQLTGGAGTAVSTRTAGVLSTGVVRFG